MILLTLPVLVLSGCSATDSSVSPNKTFKAPPDKLQDCPIIQCITCTPVAALPGGEVLIEVNACDLANNPLCYTYSSTDGTIQPVGCSAIWTAPDEIGSYPVLVRVDNGYHVVTETIMIDVVDPQIQTPKTRAIQ
jgi:hypothetical protein